MIKLFKENITARANLNVKKEYEKWKNQYPGKDYKDVKEKVIKKAYKKMTNDFKLKLDEKIKEVEKNLKLGYYEKAHKILFDYLINIDYIGQKIANDYLNHLISVAKIFPKYPKLEDYLLQPIDIQIEKILMKKNSIVEGEIPKDPESSKYCQFQMELKDIAEEVGIKRIDFDNLWFIGHVFCRPIPICILCWINDVCEKKDDKAVKEQF